jgi:hypothetical protein
MSVVGLAYIPVMLQPVSLPINDAFTDQGSWQDLLMKNDQLVEKSKLPSNTTNCGSCSAHLTSNQKSICAIMLRLIEVPSFSKAKATLGLGI